MWGAGMGGGAKLESVSNPLVLIPSQGTHAAEVYTYLHTPYITYLSKYKHVPYCNIQPMVQSRKHLPPCLPSYSMVFVEEEGFLKREKVVYKKQYVGSCIRRSLRITLV